MFCFKQYTDMSTKYFKICSGKPEAEDNMSKKTAEDKMLIFWKGYLCVTRDSLHPLYEILF